MTSRLAGRSVLLLVVLATLGCDRVTKQVATTMLAGMPAREYLGQTVWVGYVENSGGFLGLGAGLPEAVRTAVFVGATGLMLLIMAVAGLRRRLSGWPAVGLALFVAGGASNWIDRLAHGRVVDFLSVGVGPLRTGVFNVADVAVLAGALLFVWSHGAPTRPQAGPRGSESGTTQE